MPTLMAGAHRDEGHYWGGQCCQTPSVGSPGALSDGRPEMRSARAPRLIYSPDQSHHLAVVHPVTRLAKAVPAICVWEGKIFLSFAKRRRVKASKVRIDNLISP